jgi:predicted nucleic acid-binding Zn ribbon protein
MIINKENILKYLKNYFLNNKKSPIILDPKHPFKYFHIKKYFNTWNNALSEAGVPLNKHDIILTQCSNCLIAFNKQYKEMKKSENDFCSHKCSAIFNNTGRKMSEETKEKIRQKLQIIKYTKCKICNIEFRYHKRKKMTCSDKCLSDLKKLNNRKKREIILDADDE